MTVGVHVRLQAGLVKPWSDSVLIDLVTPRAEHMMPHQKAPVLFVPFEESLDLAARPLPKYHTQSNWRIQQTADHQGHRNELRTNTDAHYAIILILCSGNVSPCELHQHIQFSA